MRPFPSLVCVALLSLGGCRCAGPLRPAETDLAAPRELHFPATWVGQSSRATLELTNGGVASASVDVATLAPFALDVETVVVPGGDHATLEVRFVPEAAGRFEGVLKVGALEVQLDGEGLEPPMCVAPTVCTSSTFDPEQGVCSVAPSADGVTCNTACVSGNCLAAQCVGVATSCADGDACTVDFCAEASGCGHAPVDCPPASDPCAVATCDPASGCGFASAPDGTLCGPDDCTRSDVNVCILGACVTRARPSSGLCTDTWLPLEPPPRQSHAAAFDRVRQRLIIFGGYDGEALDDTWEWDGTTWTLRTPPQSPPPRESLAAAFDTRRGRLVVFGGAVAGAQLDDTWEWDGTTWLKLRPPVSPPARSGHALAFDEARGVTVLFGGRRALNDTWEWNGSTWTRRTPAQSPVGRERHVMAYDPGRRRVVLFGGRDLAYAELGDSWEWDGTSWVQLAGPGPSPRYDAALAWDAPAQELLLYGGRTGSGNAALSDTFALNAAGWRALQAAPSAGARYGAVATTGRGGHALLTSGVVVGPNVTGATADLFDWTGTGWAAGPLQPRPEARTSTALVSRGQSLLLHGGVVNGGHVGDTWTRVGPSWQSVSAAGGPGVRSGHAMAWDAARQVSVLFGGTVAQGLTNDTWEHDGNGWLARSPALKPSARRFHAMAFDAPRGVVVVFGGNTMASTSAVVDETWLWDGTTWTERSPPGSPPARASASLSLDPTRARLVLFGGYDGVTRLGDTWEWDGTSWAQRSPAQSPAARTAHAAAWDAARGRLVLFGGYDGSKNLADTWEWDGAEWTPRAPRRSPSARAGHAMVFDPVLGRVVLLGGNGNELWQFVP